MKTGKLGREVKIDEVGGRGCAWEVKNETVKEVKRTGDES